MRRKLLWVTLLALPLAVGGLIYAGVQASENAQSIDASFICPVTGEKLPCPKCCPLN